MNPRPSSYLVTESCPLPHSDKTIYRELAHGLGLRPKGLSLTRSSTAVSFQRLSTELVDKKVPRVYVCCPQDHLRNFLKGSCQ